LVTDKNTYLAEEPFNEPPKLVYEGELTNIYCSENQAIMYSKETLIWLGLNKSKDGSQELLRIILQMKSVDRLWYNLAKHTIVVQGAEHNLSVLSIDSTKLLFTIKKRIPPTDKKKVLGCLIKKSDQVEVIYEGGIIELHDLAINNVTSKKLSGLSSSIQIYSEAEESCVK